MSLGKSLFSARKKAGLSQEETAERLGVSRQTVSKWETDETLPDICQSQRLAFIYHLTLDELVKFNADTKEIELIIENTSEETEKEIDWTKLWGKKYPVLLKYKQDVDIGKFSVRLYEMLDELKSKYNYNDMDAFLVLKDILAGIWNTRG